MEGKNSLINSWLSMIDTGQIMGNLGKKCQKWWIIKSMRTGQFSPTSKRGKLERLVPLANLNWRKRELKKRRNWYITSLLMCPWWMSFRRNFSGMYCEPHARSQLGIKIDECGKMWNVAMGTFMGKTSKIFSRGYSVPNRMRIPSSKLPGDWADIIRKLDAKTPTKWMLDHKDQCRKCGGEKKI